MAASIYPLAPGTQYGPCPEPCLHQDCQRSRTDSAMECRICKQPIGYGNRTYQEGSGTTYNLVHADCLENEAEIAKTTFKVGDRVDMLAREDENLVWYPGKITGVGSNPVSGMFWQVHLDEEPSVLAWRAVPKTVAGECLRHSNAPMPDKGMPLSERQKRSGRFPAFGMTSDGEAHEVNPQPVTPYEFKDGDLVAIDNNRGDTRLFLVDLNNSYQNPGSEFRYSLREITPGTKDNSIYRHANEFRRATTDEQVKYLHTEADRLDDLMVKIWDQRIAIVERLMALQEQG